MNFKGALLAVIGKGLMCLLPLAACLSCSTVFTDQSDCPRGVSLRFVYDYNMEYVNSFHKKVDCVSVYVFDADGNHVDTFEEQGGVLSDESWRMTFPLGPGDYRLVAYGGLACDESSFIADVGQVKSDVGELTVSMDRDGNVCDRKLHDLYYGNYGEPLDITVLPDGYVEETMHMMKNTNNLRIILQQMNGEGISADDFTFAITDDNTKMGADNAVIPCGEITYLPWTKGQEVIGVQEDGMTPWTAAYAEFSMSRLIADGTPRLVIHNVLKEEDTINIPLVTYLLLLKSALYEDMPAQEFLDRESEWTMAFFLDSENRWYNARIVVNDWVIRLNDAQL